MSQTNYDGNSGSFDSAILAAIMESVKVLKNINTRQQKMEKDVDQLKKDSNEHRDMLNKILEKPKPHELYEIINSIDNISERLNSFDVDKFLSDQNNQLTTIEKVILRTINSSVNGIHNDIKNSNNYTMMNELKRLVDGLKNMNHNTKLVAGRMDTLSDNVNESRMDMKTLSKITIDSNTRVVSMDIRLGKIYELDGESTGTDDITASDAINLLNRFIDNDKHNEDKLQNTVDTMNNPNLPSNQDIINQSNGYANDFIKYTKQKQVDANQIKDTYETNSNDNNTFNVNNDNHDANYDSSNDDNNHDANYDSNNNDNNHDANYNSSNNDNHDANYNSSNNDNHDANYNSSQNESHINTHVDKHDDSHNVSHDNDNYDDSNNDNYDDKESSDIEGNDTLDKIERDVKKMFNTTNNRNSKK